jgi:hypothetical protein
MDSVQVAIRLLWPLVEVEIVQLHIGARYRSNEGASSPFGHCNVFLSKWAIWHPHGGLE